MADHTKIATAFGVIGTVAAIYFGVTNYLSVNVPTLELKIDNPPPYRTENDSSQITIKNVGTRASRAVNVFVTCSWEGDFDYRLRFPSEAWRLLPNEDYHWNIRLCYSGDLSKEYIKLSATEGSSSRFEVITRLHHQVVQQTLAPPPQQK